MNMPTILLARPWQPPQWPPSHGSTVTLLHPEGGNCPYFIMILLVYFSYGWIPFDSTSYAATGSYAITNRQPMYPVGARPIEIRPQYTHRLPWSCISKILQWIFPDLDDSWMAALPLIAILQLSNTYGHRWYYLHGLEGERGRWAQILLPRDSLWT